MNIALDFDGTCVKHEYPEIGEDCPNAVRVLKKITDQGHNLILNTMRGNTSEGTVQDAIKWFKDRDIPLYGVNLNPTQRTWTDSPKVYADLIIDDTSLGAFITGDVVDNELKGRFYIDWNMVETFMIKLGYIK